MKSKKNRILLFLGFTFIFISSSFLVTNDYKEFYNPKLTPYQFPQIRTFPKMPFASNNRVTNLGSKIGRYLFYDPILSKDSNISCSSCHRIERAFSYEISYRSSLKEKSLQGDRSIPPLFNLAWATSYFWDGRVKSIEDQVFNPVRNKDEMNCDWTVVEKRLNQSPLYKPLFIAAFGNKKIDSVMISKCIAQFERTLLSYNSKYDKVMRGELVFSVVEQLGYNIVNDSKKGGCLSCHSTVSNSNSNFINNGTNEESMWPLLNDKGRNNVTKKAQDIGKFRPPTFRNIGLTAPYMHDGRFDHLEDVIDFYSKNIHVNSNTDKELTKIATKGGYNFTYEEKRAILSFLMTLTDSVFISNKEYSNPFSL